MPQQHPPRYQQFQPRRRRPVRTVLLALTVVLAVAGGAVAIASSRGGEVAGRADPPTTAPSERRTPRPVSIGKAFGVGKHQMLAGWTAREEFGMFTVTGKVKNVSDGNSTAFFQVRFLRDGAVLAAVQCASDDLEPGQTGMLTCVPDGVYTTSYDRVTVEATF